MSPLSLPRYLIKIVPLKITMDSSYLFSFEKFSTLFIARGFTAYSSLCFGRKHSVRSIDRIHSIKWEDNESSGSTIFDKRKR